MRNNFNIMMILTVTLFISHSVGQDQQIQKRQGGAICETCDIEGENDSIEPQLKFPKIDRRPNPDEWRRGVLKSLPKFNPELNDFFQVDLRCYDISQLDLRDSLDDLWYASFDDRTVWPGSEFIPKEFDRRKIMELGKNPGLGIRQLHRRGITGRGIGIAIIDQALLVDHQEYVNRLRFYEEINVLPNSGADMHGAAVASIAVGSTVGVAPEADLYYIGTWPADQEKAGGDYIINFGYLARAVERILQINEQLPEPRKIRVISLSTGWRPSQKGYEEMTEAVEKAKAQGMLVICSTVGNLHGFKFDGIGRAPLADPDDFDSFKPANWGYSIELDCLLVPMDARTTASPTGTKEYVFYGQGGNSWVIPYIAGVYALAAQAEPDITPDRFWALALKTGAMIELESEGKETPFGPILNPAKLTEAIKAGDLSDKAAAAAELAKYNQGAVAIERAKYISVISSLKDIDIKDINNKVGQLDINKANPNDVIKIFGEPSAYLWGNQTFQKSNLPDRYIMYYSDSFSVFFINDLIIELRFSSPDIGYVYDEKIKLGSPLEDVLEILGPPIKTVKGQKNEGEDGVLYQDIGGQKGYCYYARQDQGVRLFFLNNRVTGLYVTRTER